MWLLLPLPLLAASGVVWGRQERAADKMLHEIARDANALALRFTFFGLIIMLLIDSAYGLPK